MDHFGKWIGVAGAAMLCAACNHNMGSTTTMGGTLAPADAYTVHLWAGNKSAEVPFPTQPVAASLRWAEADEGVAHWNEGFASNRQDKQTVRVDHPHGSLHAVRVSLQGDPAGTGPALVVDSVTVSSSTGSPSFVCEDVSPAKIQPGMSADLGCVRR
ncbi:MAG TPA: hypothetical protein VGM50_04265 [Gemmatimonadaceae bacterium]|jgi:hypothetical protein